MVGFETERPADADDAAALVPSGVAQQHQGLFRRVVDASGEFGLPKKVFVHGLLQNAGQRDGVELRLQRAAAVDWRNFGNHGVGTRRTMLEVVQ